MVGNDTFSSTENTQKGLALIFHNSLNDCNAQLDIKTQFLKDNFEKMNYDVERHFNLPCDDMKNEIKKMKRNFESVSCLLVFVSILGDKNSRWNDVLTGIINTLQGIQSLTKKPKLIFFEGISPKLNLEENFFICYSSQAYIHSLCHQIFKNKKLGMLHLIGSLSESKSYLIDNKLTEEFYFDKCVSKKK